MQGQDRMGRAIRKACFVARENFTKITSGSHLNRFVEDYIGPMELTSDGRIRHGPQKGQRPRRDPRLL